MIVRLVSCMINFIINDFRRTGKRRLAVELVILAVAAYIGFSAMRERINSTYAFTYSLGNNVGFVYRTPSYYELPEEAREVVDAHEAQHMLDGTHPWSRNEGEIRAYQAELVAIHRKQAEIRKRPNTAKNRLLLYILNLLETDALENIESYTKNLEGN